MRKGNGSNGVPAWVKIDLQVLKRVSVSLADTVRDTRLDMAEARRDIAETRRDMAEMNRANQRRFAENEKILAELRHRNDRLEEQTASLKRMSDIHSKAILKLLKKN